MLEYRQINYLTGMGTSVAGNVTRSAGIMSKTMSGIGSLVSDTFGKSINAFEAVGPGNRKHSECYGNCKKACNSYINSCI